LGHIPRDVASETEEDIVTSNTSDQSISVATPFTPLIQPAPEQSNHQSIRELIFVPSVVHLRILSTNPLSISLNVPASPLPKNNAMHGVDSQDNIVQVIKLARQLADRIGATAETSAAKIPDPLSLRQLPRLALPSQKLPRIKPLQAQSRRVRLHQLDHPNV
jgi:hypothetical protein